MQIHGYNHHYNGFGKNPFGGEAFRVFMAVEGDDDGTDTISETTAGAAPSADRANKDESIFVEHLRELIEKENSAGEPKNKMEVEEKWSRLIETHNGASAYYKWADETYKKIEKVERTDTDWKKHIKLVNDGLDKIVKYTSPIEEASMGVLDPIQIAELEAKDFNDKKSVVLDKLKQAKEGLEKVKNQSEKDVKEQLKKDMQARLDRQINKFKNNPPAAFKREPLALNQQIGEIKKVKNVIRGLSTQGLGTQYDDAGKELDNFAEYKAIWRDIDFFDAVYDGEKSTDDYHSKFEKDNGKKLGVAALEKKLKALENFRKNRVKAMQAEHNAYVGKTRSGLEKMKARLAGLTEDDVQNKDKVIEDIDNQLESLEELGDIDAITKKALYFDPPIDPEDPDKKLKNKGLALQIADIKSSDMNDSQKEVLLVALDQALEQFKKELSGSLSGNLDVILDQIDTMNRTLDAPKARGGKWNISWVAPYDAIRGFEIIRDWGTRKLKRQSSYRIGQFGSKALAGLSKLPIPLTYFNTLPNEFDKEQESAEQQEVEEYKKAYANKDMWQVEAIAYATQNKDEFKACLFLLAENGRLRWDRIPLIKAFNYHQSSVILSTDMKRNLGNISAFYEDLRKACGSIWDFDTFKDLKTKNSSAYDSKKNEWEQSCHEWAETVGLNTILDGYLKEYKEARANGTNPTFDPLAYEKIIDYSMKQGKMGSEEKLYFLIQGIAWGILPPDRGSVLNSIYINGYPAIDFFGAPTKRSNKPTLEDLQEIAIFDKNAFKDWYYRKAMTTDQVTQRIDKVLTGGQSMDHDDLVGYLGYMSLQTTKTVLKAQTQGYLLPQTGVENGTVSMVNYMDHIAFNHQRMLSDDIDTKKQLSRFIGSFATYNGILMNNAHKNRDYFRLNSDSLDSKPRTAGAYEQMYGRGGTTVRENLKLVESHLKVLDPVFFTFLFDNPGGNVQGMVNKLFEIHKAELIDRLPPAQTSGKSQEEIEKLVSYKDLFGGNEVTNIDQLHDMTTDYVNFLIDSNNGKAKIQEMFSVIESQQKATKEHEDFVKNLKTYEDPAKNEGAYEEMRTARGTPSGITGGSSLNSQFLSKTPDRAELQALSTQMQGGSGF